MELAMRNIFGLAAIPLFCMGVIVLAALVIIFALRRGTRTINEKAEQILSEDSSAPSGNTRWARGDMQGEPAKNSPEIPMAACPACGAENPSGSGTCAYCGSKL